MEVPFESLIYPRSERLRKVFGSMYYISASSTCVVHICKSVCVLFLDLDIFSSAPKSFSVAQMSGYIFPRFHQTC